MEVETLSTSNALAQMNIEAKVCFRGGGLICENGLSSSEMVPATSKHGRWRGRLGYELMRRCPIQAEILRACVSSCSNMLSPLMAGAMTLHV